MSYNYIRLNISDNKRSRLRALARPLLSLPLWLVFLFLGVSNFSFLSYLFDFDFIYSIMSNYNLDLVIISYNSVLKIFLFLIALYSSLMFLLFIDVVFVFVPVFAFAVDLIIIFYNGVPEWLIDNLKKIFIYIMKFKLFLLLLTDKAPDLLDFNKNNCVVFPNEVDNVWRLSPVTRKLRMIPQAVLLLFCDFVWLILFMPMWLWVCASGFLPKWYFKFSLFVFSWHMHIAYYCVFYRKVNPSFLRGK